ncbi:MAG: putative acetyltransferase [Bacteroidetes bacterium]|nr:putative acetyltransferase [Bacteroidota bacterium]
MKKLFVSDKNRGDDYANELAYAYEKLKAAEGNLDIITPAGLNEGLLEEKQIDVVISNGLTAEWHNVLKSKGYVSIVFDTLDPYEQLADIVIDYKANNSTVNYGTAQFSLMSNPAFDFAPVADLVKKLQWDTEFWGYGVGNIKSKTLTENIYYKSEKAARESGINVLEYLCSCDDRESLRTAEDLGFHLSDIRLTFDMKAVKIKIDPLPEGLTYGLAEERHIPELIDISKDLYRESRYYFDGGFDKKRVSDFYNIWVGNAVKGTFDHLCYCIFDGDRPVGFATFRHYGPQTGYIGLAGFTNVNKGQGLGKKLFSHLINESVDKGMTKMVTATQGRNYTAQRLFQSIGFKTCLAELWYHKWLS